MLLWGVGTWHPNEVIPKEYSFPDGTYNILGLDYSLLCSPDCIACRQIVDYYSLRYSPDCIACMQTVVHAQ